MIEYYIKKPIPVEVMRFVYVESSMNELREWMGESLGLIKKARHPDAKAEAQIVTLEDGKYLKVKHIATEGDYIVKGFAGEFWAVKPEIFEATYELV